MNFSVIVLAVIFYFPPGFMYGQQASEEIPQLENPFTTSYLKSHLRKSTPRLVLTTSIEKELKSKLKTDLIVNNYYQAMVFNSKGILEK